MLAASRFGKNRFFIVHYVYVSYFLSQIFIETASSLEAEPKLMFSRFSMIDRDSKR
jgi:ATP-dependent Lon protease